MAIRHILGPTLCMAVVLPAPLAMAAEPAETIVYAVRQGDTLYGLAAKYLTGQGAMAQLRSANRVRIPERMPIGMKLAIPRKLLRFTPVAVRLQSFSGPVSLSQGAPLQKGAELPEGTEVATGANGFAVLSSADGTRVSLPSNSTVRIGTARRYLLIEATDIELAVQRGRAEVQAAKQGPASRFRVRTPVAVTAVRGTTFRAGYFESTASSATEAIEGEVGVATAKAELAIPAGFGAAASASGDLAKEALLPAPALADPSRLQTEAVVSFDLKPVGQASGYRLQVARDAGFQEVIAEVQPTVPRGDFTGLGNGTFFMRALAISASGLQGLEEAWSFRRQRVGLAADAGQSALPGGFRFAWQSEGEGRSLFRFQLFADPPGGLPVIDEAGLDRAELTLTGLKPGTYRWRVGVIQTTPDGSAEVWMPLQKFTFGG